MSGTYTYVYQACQIVIQQETEQRWTYVVISNEEYYEPHPAKAFDSEEGALKAAAAFCDYRMGNVSPIDGFHRRKKMSLSV
jgi:hypothetical protein